MESYRVKNPLFIFSSETWPVKVRFHMEPPWVWGTKVFLSHLGHMIKMAALLIYGKNTLKISGTKGPMALGLSMQHWGHGPNKV